MYTCIMVLRRDIALIKWYHDAGPPDFMEQTFSSNLVPSTGHAQSVFIQAKINFDHNLLRWVKNEDIDVEAIDQYII